MKYFMLLIPLFYLVIATPLCADTIVCNDGKTLNAVIVSESEKAVTIQMGGAKVVIPRKDIRSITRSTSGEDARIERQWKQLNEHYRGESREEETLAASGEAEPPPTPLPAPEPEPAEPTRQEQIVFPAEPPPPESASGPLPPTKEQKRIQWEQDIHRAIHEKRVIPGMTAHQVQAAWDFPFSTAPVNNIDTHTDRWTYHRPEGRVYVYFKNGKVVSVVQ